MGDEFTRYLLAKRTVDDRALSRPVLEWVRGFLARIGRPPRVLELGAGLGTMVMRLAEWRVLERAEYTLIDRDEESLARAEGELWRWAEGRGFAVEPRGDRLRLGDGLEVARIAADLAVLGETLAGQPPYDLVMAHAVLDLVDVPALLPELWKLAPGGAYWFSLNFDGETIFTPEHPLDGQVMALYHASMDERRARGRGDGHSQTGRRLLTQLPEAGAGIEAAGASDWVVWPNGAAYPAEEASFLRHILATIGAELRGHDALDAAAFEAWLATRTEQIDSGALCYIAHQLDVAGNIPGRDGA